MGTVLFSEMIPDASYEKEFNEWYDQEHIPLRMRVPGFRSAQRYLVPGTRHYLAIYEVESPAVLKTPAYQEVKNNPSERTRWMLRNVGGFTRYIAEQIHAPEIEAIDAPSVHAVFSNEPDHSPKDCLMVRRFRIIDGEPEKWTHLALYYLAESIGLQSVFAKHGVRQWNSNLESSTPLSNTR